jgi:ABC-2 type transport system permease protein
MRWLLLKDLQILRRSPLLVALLVIYPVAIALLIGFALSRGPERPRVAFLNLVPPSENVVSLGGQRVDASRYSRQLFQSIQPVRVRSRAEAVDKVRSGDVLAALIIPADVTERLTSGLQPAQVEVIYNGDALKQAFVQSTISSKLAEGNAALADLLKRVAIQEVDLLLRGGTFSLLGRTIDILGLKATQAIVHASVPQLPRHSPTRAALGRVDQFATLAVENLDLSKKVLATLSQPLQVKSTLLHGRRTPLDSFAVAVAVAVSLMFVCVLLAAGMLALEREENAFGRLVRGLVRRETLLAEKVVLAGGCSFCVTLVMLMGIGLFVGLDWSRFALWLVALLAGALAFAGLGVAIGSVAREVRAASLLALLLSLPLAFLALVPSGAVAVTLYDVTRVISAAFPFKPALQAINTALNGGSPALAVSLLHLLGLALAFGVLARVAIRRFA